MVRRPTTAPQLRAVPSEGDASADMAPRESSADAVEAELLARAREGEEGAWAELYDRNFSTVLTRVRYLVGRIDLAEELTQESFVQAMLKIDRFDGRAQFRSWVKAIALNIVRNHWRSEKVRRRAQGRLTVVETARREGQDAPLDQAVLERERSKALYAALERLPENLREVFVLRDIEGLGCEAISEQLGLSRNNVSVRCTRARHRLHEELRAMGWLAGSTEDGDD